MTKNYKVTIIPAIEIDPSAMISFTYSQREQAIRTRDALADLLLFIQDDLSAMDDFSNSMFIEEQIDGGEWMEGEEKADG